MEKELNDEVLGSKEGTKTVYEVSYILLPTLSEEQVPDKVSSIKDAVTSLGGEVISSEDPVLIDLAYEMVKVVQTSRYKADRGYFGWVI
jgi:ribosomal protein S6